MATPIAMLPQSVPFLMSNGTISTQWYMFFQFLYVRTGGAIAESNTELQSQIDSAPVQTGFSGDFSDEVAWINQFMDLNRAEFERMIDEQNCAPAQQVSLNDYDPAAVAITGGSIDSTGIGATTPANGKFVALTTGEAAQILNTSIASTNYAGAAAGTLLNSPAAGNPVKWCAFNDNGTLRKFPTW
jgi:hypothetical protein